MRRMLIAVLLAGGVFGAIITVVPAREAKANVAGDLYDACASDWTRCAATAAIAYDVAKTIWGWADGGDLSYVEECPGEGCSHEEVRETYGHYKEELISEGGSYEEVKEITFTTPQRTSLDDMQQNAFTLVMLKDFQNRGWRVRPQDLTSASGG